MPDATDSQTAQERGDVLTAISEGIVALLKDFYGRGPTHAKSYYQDDLVVCLLRGGFTKSSRRCSTAAVATRWCSSECSFSN